MKPEPLPQHSKLVLMRAAVERHRAENDAFLHRQYLGDAADRVLEQLREAFAADQINLETLERVTEDIVHGRPTRLPFPLLIRTPYRSRVF